MKKEIKFRGNRIGAPHEILIGDLNFIHEGRPFIFQRTPETPLNSPDWFEVKLETVGQFIGEKDKQGKEIFEGDRLKVPGFKFEGFEDADAPEEAFTDLIGKVTFETGCFGVHDEAADGMGFVPFIAFCKEEIEIIE